MEAHTAPYTELLYFYTLMLGRIFFGLLACCLAISAAAQSAILYGTVRDANGQVIETVHVFDKMRASRYFDFTDAAGVVGRSTTVGAMMPEPFVLSSSTQ